MGHMGPTGGLLGTLFGDLLETLFGGLLGVREGQPIVNKRVKMLWCIPNWQFWV